MQGSQEEHAEYQAEQDAIAKVQRKRREAQQMEIYRRVCMSESLLQKSAGWLAKKTDRVVSAVGKKVAEQTRRLRPGHEDLDPTVAAYIRDGISLRGLQHTLALFGESITDSTTTSDLCHALI